MRYEIGRIYYFEKERHKGYGLLYNLSKWYQYSSWLDSVKKWMEENSVKICKGIHPDIKLLYKQIDKDNCLFIRSRAGCGGSDGYIKRWWNRYEK